MSKRLKEKGFLLKTSHIIEYNVVFSIDGITLLLGSLE